MEKYVKLKVFYWIVGILIALNLTVLAFMWFGRPPMPGPPPHGEYGPMGGPPGDPGNRMGGMPQPKRVTGFFKEQLGWNDEQEARFQPLLEAYQKESLDFFDSVSVIRKEMFNEIFTDGSRKDSLINRISVLQRRIDISRYEHFKDISEICTPEQREKFKELLNNIPEKGDLGPRRGPPGGMPPPGRMPPPGN